jgi:hypothetical protein
MSDKLIVTVDSQNAALLPRFLAYRAADVGKIRAALAGADFEAMRGSGHGMKGAGGGYRFPGISRLGAAPEEGPRGSATLRRSPRCWQAWNSISGASKSIMGDGGAAVSNGQNQDGLAHCASATARGLNKRACAGRITRRGAPRVVRGVRVFPRPEILCLLRACPA